MAEAQVPLIARPDARVRFTIEDADRAYQEWGANCGPTAIAAIAGLTLDEVRPHMGDFERKGYTNPTLMWKALESADLDYERIRPPVDWPVRGVVRVQWGGPWMKPNVPRVARYRHTHWIAVEPGTDGWTWAFDVNCMCVGGWVPLTEWITEVAPWLMREVCPKGDRTFTLADVAEVPTPREAE